MMNNRDRFRQTLLYGAPDRILYFENEIQRRVLAHWRRQGLASTRQLRETFPVDAYEEIEPYLNPLPPIHPWSAGQSVLSTLQKRLNINNPLHLPANWFKLTKLGAQSQQVLILVAHQGFFLSLGVGDWQSFDLLIENLRENRLLIRRWMEIYGEFAAQLADKILSRVRVDAALFNEPIGGFTGSLISPAMYRELVLPGYQPILDVLARYHIPIIIFRTYANARLLLPEVLRAGMNCLWAYECNNQQMNYVELRREFGRDLSLIGGIDLDALRRNKEAIYQEIEEKVPVLLAAGGYLPAADGRIREDISFENYVYYRGLLKKYIQI
jgi:hypothetical protein